MPRLTFCGCCFCWTVKSSCRPVAAHPALFYPSATGKNNKVSCRSGASMTCLAAFASQWHSTCIRTRVRRGSIDLPPRTMHRRPKQSLTSYDEQCICDICEACSNSKTLFPSFTELWNLLSELLLDLRRGISHHSPGNVPNALRTLPTSQCHPTRMAGCSFAASQDVLNTLL